MAKVVIHAGVLCSQEEGMLREQKGDGRGVGSRGEREKGPGRMKIQPVGGFFFF